MKAVARDYYEVLGVSRTATPEEIRRAHRKLARQHHPDVSKAPDAAQKFAEIQQAYDVLSEERKRKLYDQYGHAAFEGAGPPPPGQGGGRPHRSQGAAGAGFEGFDADDLQEFFDSVFGGRGSPGGFPRQERRGRAAEPLRATIRVPFSLVAGGGKQSLRVGESVIEVRVPAGIEDGTQLRMRGAADGRDVIVTVHAEPHPLLRRGEQGTVGKGLDLYLDLPLTYAEAALGAVVRVPTPDGSADLTVPAGTRSGRKLLLKGKGLRDDAGRYGDLYVIVEIVPPAGELTEAQRQMLRDLNGRTPPPRTGAGWPG
jgi:DnaJ-class molecular chaperone